MKRFLLALLLVSVLAYLIPGASAEGINSNNSVVRVFGNEFQATGAVINSNGCVLTNAHVVQFQRPFVQSEDGLVRQYILVTLDAQGDLAVICPVVAFNSSYFKVQKLTSLPSVKENFVVKGWDYILKNFYTQQVMVGGKLSVSMFPSVYENALLLLPLGVSELKLGFSGSPILSKNHTIVGLLAFCHFWKDNPTHATFCGAINSDRIIEFLSKSGVVFEVETA